MSGAGALGAAATGAEPAAAFLGTVAAGSGAVSTLASGLSGAVKLANGDYSGSATSFGTALFSLSGARAIQSVANLQKVTLNYSKLNLSVAAVAGLAGGAPKITCGR